jgi:NAD(P)-dependent dehydrogenase (short-subunit alcohol dehydrogenase family)
LLGTLTGMFAGKAVLMTGALGTLGQALVGRFAAEHAEVYAWDRPDSPDAQCALDRIAEGVRFVGGDLNDLAATQAQAIDLANDVGGIHSLLLYYSSQHIY